MFVVRVYPKDGPEKRFIFDTASEAEECTDEQIDYWQLFEDERFICEGP